MFGIDSTTIIVVNNSLYEPIWFLGHNKLHSRRHTDSLAVFAGFIHQKSHIHCNECMKIMLKIQQFTSVQQKVRRLLLDIILSDIIAYIADQFKWCRHQ